MVGVIITAIIQSSSATTVMVVGFVAAGLLPLQTAAYIIMGANVGTTITAQMIAFNIPLYSFELADIAPFVLLGGVVMMMIVKRKNAELLAQVLAGFGVLFIGITLMGSALKPLKDVPQLREWMLRVADRPLLGVLLGAGATGVIQSSSAFTGIIQALAKSTQAVTLSSVVYMVMGSNIGTCVTAIIASLGSSKMAKRTSVFHLLFNIIGAVFVFIMLHFFSGPILGWIESLTPGDVSWQIANVHTLFNLGTLLLCFFIVPAMLKLTYCFVRGEDPIPEPMKLLYCGEKVFKSHALVVPALLNEVRRMSDLAYENFQSSVDMLLSGNLQSLPRLKEVEEVLNYLNQSITEQLVKANHIDLSARDTDILSSLFHVVNDLERIGDHAEHISEAAVSMDNAKAVFSESCVEDLHLIIDKVTLMMPLSMEVLTQHDPAVLAQVEALEQEVDDLRAELEQRHIMRLNQGICTPQLGLVLVSVITNLERVADHANSIAQSINM